MPMYENYGGTQGFPYGSWMDRPPGPQDDANNLWCESAIWQYLNPATGKIEMHMCIDSTPNAAVWAIFVTSP